MQLKSSLHIDSKFAAEHIGGKEAFLDRTVEPSLYNRRRGQISKQIQRLSYQRVYCVLANTTYDVHVV